MPAPLVEPGAALHEPVRGSACASVLGASPRPSTASASASGIRTDSPPSGATVPPAMEKASSNRVPKPAVVVKTWPKLSLQSPPRETTPITAPVSSLMAGPPESPWQMLCPTSNSWGPSAVRLAEMPLPIWSTGTPALWRRVPSGSFLSFWP